VSQGRSVRFLLALSHAFSHKRLLKLYVICNDNFVRIKDTGVDFHSPHPIPAFTRSATSSAEPPATNPSLTHSSFSTSSLRRCRAVEARIIACLHPLTVTAQIKTPGWTAMMHGKRRKKTSLG
jgi:hypothetical protein